MGEHSSPLERGTADRGYAETLVKVSPIFYDVAPPLGYCSRRTILASPINVFGKEENGGNGGRVRNNRMVVVAVVA